MERYCSRLKIELIANTDGDNKEIRGEIFSFFFLFFFFFFFGGDHVDECEKRAVRARCHRNRNARLDARIDKRRVKRAVLHRARAKLGPLLLSPLWKRVPRPVFTDQL